VVDVAAAHLDVAEGTDVMGDGGDQKAHRQEGDEETDGGKEETALGSIGDLLMDDLTGFGEVKNEQNGRGDEGYEDQEDPGSGDVHR
jgi:hypothetical protein